MTSTITLTPTADIDRLYQQASLEFQPDRWLSEMIQNSIRSGSETIAVLQYGDDVLLVDQGIGLPDPNDRNGYAFWRSLVDYSSSAWDAEVQEQQKPAGKGMFSLLFNYECDILSNRHRLSVTPHELRARTSLNIVADHGDEISFAASKLGDSPDSIGVCIRIREAVWKIVSAEKKHLHENCSAELLHAIYSRSGNPIRLVIDFDCLENAPQPLESGKRSPVIASRIDQSVESLLKQSPWLKGFSKSYPFTSKSLPGETAETSFLALEPIIEAGYQVSFVENTGSYAYPLELEINYHGQRAESQNLKINGLLFNVKAYLHIWGDSPIDMQLPDRRRPISNARLDLFQQRIASHLSSYFDKARQSIGRHDRGYCPLFLGEKAWSPSTTLYDFEKPDLDPWNDLVEAEPDARRHYHRGALVSEPTLYKAVEFLLCDFEDTESEECLCLYKTISSGSGISALPEFENDKAECVNPVSLCQAFIQADREGKTRVAKRAYPRSDSKVWAHPEKLLDPSSSIDVDPFSERAYAVTYSESDCVQMPSHFGSHVIRFLKDLTLHAKLKTGDWKAMPLEKPFIVPLEIESPWYQSSPIWMVANDSYRQLLRNDPQKALALFIAAFDRPYQEVLDSETVNTWDEHSFNCAKAYKKFKGFFERKSAADYLKKAMLLLVSQELPELREQTQAYDAETRFELLSVRLSKGQLQTASLRYAQPDGSTSRLIFENGSWRRS